MINKLRYRFSFSMVAVACGVLLAVSFIASQSVLAGIEDPSIIPDESLTHPVNPVARNFGTWSEHVDEGGAAPGSTNDSLIFRKGSFSGNKYYACNYIVDESRFLHIQHTVRLPNKNGHAYFASATSWARDFSDNLYNDGLPDGSLSVYKSDFPVDPTNDRVINVPANGGLYNDGTVGEIIWEDRYQSGQFGYNHPGKMQVIGNLLLVSMENWAGTAAGDFCLDDGIGTADDSIFFYDIRDPENPKYWGRLTRAELGITGAVNNVSMARFGELWVLGVGDKYFYATDVSPEISNWTYGGQFDVGELYTGGILFEDIYVNEAYGASQGSVFESYEVYEETLPGGRRAERDNEYLFIPPFIITEHQFWNDIPVTKLPLESGRRRPINFNGEEDKTSYSENRVLGDEVFRFEPVMFEFNNQRYFDIDSVNRPLAKIGWDMFDVNYYRSAPNLHAGDPIDYDAGSLYVTGGIPIIYAPQINTSIDVINRVYDDRNRWLSLDMALNDVPSMAAETGWVFSGSGDWFANWDGDGINGNLARTSLMKNNQSASIETQISGIGTLHFRWKVSSEAGKDFLRFEVGNVEVVSAISGDTGQWVDVSVPISALAGYTTLRWTFEKDNDDVNSVGEDVAYIDNVRFDRDNSIVASHFDDGGVTTLRKIIESGQTHITFDASLDGVTFNLFNNPLVLTQDITIDASALPNGITLDGVYGVRVLEVNSGVVAALKNVSISNGAAVNGAGVLNQGTLTMTKPSFINNHASGNGGGIYNQGNLTLIDATFIDNESINDGGAIYNVADNVTVTNSTLVNNVARSGAAIYNGNNAASTVTITNSTFTGNSSNAVGNAGGLGGALFSSAGILTLKHTTITDNYATFGGGGIYQQTATINIENSIVAGNTDLYNAFPDFYSDVANTVINSSGQNFIGDNSGVSGFFQVGTFVGTSGSVKKPMLDVLRDKNGGFAQTMIPQLGSPVIDAATNSSQSFDQRGYARPSGPQSDIGAVEVIDLVVSSTNNGLAGSLAEALEQNADYISFSPTLSGETISLESTLDLSKNVTISASNLQNGLTLDGNNTVRIINIQRDVEVFIDGVTVTKGRAPQGENGGGIYNDRGILNLSGASVIDNHTDEYFGGTFGAGGGIFNRQGGVVRLTNCTLADNSASAGGALWNDYGDTELFNSTVSDNMAESGGGIFSTGGSLNFVYTTISSNKAMGSGNEGGGGLAASGTLYMQNSIIAGNTTNGLGHDIRESFVDPLILAPGSSHNFIGNNETVTDLFHEGTLVGTAVTPKYAQLSGLSINGGPNRTQHPRIGSPVIDAAVINTYVTDQRGQLRPVGANPDIGAVEVANISAGVVTSAADDINVIGSLRQVIDAAPVDSTLTFDPAVFDGNSIALSSALVLSKNVSINASNLPNGLTIDANKNSRVFEVTSGTTVSIEGVTITGGKITGNGGGIQNEGDLSLVNSTLIGNQSTYYGGGIINFGGSLTMTNTIVADNTADYGGGGIYNGNTANSSVTLINTTLSGNSSFKNSGGVGGYGGAIYSYLGEVTLRHVTIVNNSADVFAGGIYQNGGTFHTENSIIAGNLDPGSAPDYYSNAIVDSTGENVIGNNAGVSGWFPESMFVGTPASPLDPLLAPLKNNGGSTSTMQPLYGSPVIDAAIITINSPVTDQRGTLRTIDSEDDIGAVEVADNYGIVMTELDDGSVGSLRVVLDTGDSGGIITFDPSINGKLFYLNSALIFSKDMSISALDLPNGITLVGTSTSRVLEIESGHTVSIEGIWMTLGNVTGSGGGINNEGDLTLVSSTVSGNNASAYGGGINNSTGKVTLINSTVAENIAGFGGGGIYNYLGEITLRHTTVANNDAGTYAGGIHQNGGTVYIENSILAGNVDAAGTPDFYTNANVAPTGQNIIGDNSGVSAWFPGGGFVGTSATPLDPMLAPLANHGGPSRTMSPLLGSLAINSAIVTINSPDQDQRLIVRPQGVAPDIGSVEKVLIDTDSDGINDHDETVLGMLPYDVDSDGDGLADGIGGIVPLIVYPTGVDNNGDGFVDGEQDYGTDPVLSDSDGDGYSDGVEAAAGTDPLDDASFPSPDGDVNGDGQVDVADLLLAMRILNGQYIPTPTEQARWDVAPLVNGVPQPDGLNTLGDYVVLQQKVLGGIDF